MKKTILLLTSLGLYNAAQAQIGFDSETELTTNFTVASNDNSGDITEWEYVASGGNSGGYVNVPANYSAFGTENTSFSLDLSQDQSFTIRAHILTSTNLFPRNNYPALSLGFTASNPATDAQEYAGGGLYTETSIVAGITAKDDGTSGGATNRYGYHFGAGHTASGMQITGGSVNDLSTSTWYQLEANFTYTDATNDFSGETVLKSADGSETVRAVSFTGATIANPWGADDTVNFYAFFGGRENLNAGIQGVDNFQSPATTVVPESGAFALISGALALGFITTRRRR